MINTCSTKILKVISYMITYITRSNQLHLYIVGVEGRECREWAN